MTTRNLETPTFDPSILEANGVRLNLVAREVVCDGIQVNITPVEFEILEVLMRSAGRVVSRDELLRALSDKQANLFEGGLEILVIQLKSKLERGRLLIRIIPEAGYLFPATDEHVASDYQLA